MAATSVAYPAEWSARRLIGLMSLGFLLVGSWLSSFTRPLWDRCDAAVFRCLNGTLENETLRNVWAYTNWRPSDFLPGFLLLVLLLIAIRRDELTKIWFGWSSLILLTLGILLMKWLVSEVLLNKILDYHRQSPSLVFGDVLRLSEMVPWVKAKDNSHWCFPGDHGFVMITIAIYLTWRSKRVLAILGWLVAFVFVLPRLAAGAHWLTDIVVGSAAMAICCSAILLATPLHNWLAGKMSDVAEPIIRRNWHRATGALTASRD